MATVHVSNALARYMMSLEGRAFAAAFKRLIDAVSISLEEIRMWGFNVPTEEP